MRERFNRLCDGSDNTVGTAGMTAKFEMSSRRYGVLRREESPRLAMWDGTFICRPRRAAACGCPHRRTEIYLPCRGGYHPPQMFNPTAQLRAANSCPYGMVRITAFPRRDAPCGCPHHRTEILLPCRDRRPRRSVYTAVEVSAIFCPWAIFELRHGASGTTLPTGWYV